MQAKSKIASQFLSPAYRPISAQPAKLDGWGAAGVAFPLRARGLRASELYSPPVITRIRGALPRESLHLRLDRGEKIQSRLADGVNQMPHDERSRLFNLRSACLVKDAELSTHGLTPVRRRHGPGGFRDRSAADAWAREQPWYGRVVRYGMSRGWCTWWISPARDSGGGAP